MTILTEKADVKRHYRTYLVRASCALATLLAATSYFFLHGNTSGGWVCLMFCVALLIGSIGNLLDFLACHQP